MESLNERLAERKMVYEELVEAEYLAESYLEKILPLFPPSSKCTGNIYNRCAFLYILVDSVEDFEENIITLLSEMLNVTWKRTVTETDISHYTSIFIKDKNFQIYLTVYSKPTNSCRIIAVPTGKVKKVSKAVMVDEAEIEYLIECSEEAEPEPEPEAEVGKTEEGRT